MIDKGSHIYHAVGIGLGVLGVIAEVTLQCVDSFNLREIRSTHSLSHCRDHLLELARGGDYVKLWIEINSKSCYLFSGNITTKVPQSQPSTSVSNIKVSVTYTSNSLNVFIAVDVCT